MANLNHLKKDYQLDQLSKEEKFQSIEEIININNTIKSHIKNIINKSEDYYENIIWHYLNNPKIINFLK